MKKIISKINAVSARAELLSGAALKYIAMLSMLIDHTNKALLYPRLNGGALNVISDFADIIGRIAFPLFCFMLVEGFFKTRSRLRYLFNLLMFGVISEIPFDMLTTATFFNFNWNNVLFTLSLVLVTLWGIDYLKNKMSRPLWYILSAVILAVMCITAMLLGLDYDYHAILIGYFFYIFHNARLLYIPFCFAAMYKEPWALLGFGLTLTYNGERGRQNKLLGYLFYPVHMAVLGVIRLIFNI